jgi:hypothetical protein
VVDIEEDRRRRALARARAAVCAGCTRPAKLLAVPVRHLGRARITHGKLHPPRACRNAFVLTPPFGLIPCHALSEIEKTKLNQTEKDRAFKKREARFRKTALEKKPISVGFSYFSDEAPNVSESCSRPGRFRSFQASHAIAVQCHLRSLALSAQFQQVHRTPALVFRALPSSFSGIPVAASAPPSI